MESSVKGDPNTVSLNAKEGFYDNYKKIAKGSPKLAKVYVFLSIVIYSLLFFMTGALVSSLTGWSWLASTALIFLARLCLS